MKQKTERAHNVRIPALFPRWVSTAGGLGYLPLMPGTFGSIGGVALYAAALALAGHLAPQAGGGAESGAAGIWLTVPAAFAVSAFGVWAAGFDAREIQMKDPQFIVVDEVSGQMIALLVALAPLNWKYLVAGLILFRGFDIWKPFPVRQAESLVGGWGIMADDWLAGVYAGLGLWVLRFLKVL